MKILLTYCLLFLAHYTYAQDKISWDFTKDDYVEDTDYIYKPYVAIWSIDTPYYSSTPDTLSYIKYIDVVDKKNQQLLDRIFTPKQSSYHSATFQYTDIGTLVVEDMNFDGYNDIRAFYSATANFRKFYWCWLFNPKTKKFEFHQGLTALSEPYFNHKKRLVHSRYTISVNGYYHSIYRFLADTLDLMIKQSDEHLIGTGEHYWFIEKYFHGKLIDKHSLKIEDWQFPDDGLPLSHHGKDCKLFINYCDTCDTQLLKKLSPKKDK